MEFSNLKKKFQNPFKQDDSRFILACGIKFSGIYLVISFFTFYVMWLLLSLNHIYFQSYGFIVSDDLTEAFFDNALSIFYNQLPAIFGFVVALFFAGLYLGKILLRPFEVIGQYSIDRTEGKQETYNPDLFSDYKLLTRFSEFFFRYLDDCQKSEELSPNTIPPNFAKIRGPQFEKVFFFHFILLIILLGIISGMMVIYFTTEVHSQLVNLSLSTIAKESKTVGYFLTNQNKLLPSITIVSVIALAIGYIALSFHLYGKVSGAIFGFFATMRSFMKGNYSARVHLIGYAQIRPHGRALNKYLDHIERVCAKNGNIK